ncbi:Uncharacterised protein [Escherichia coli]|uniref:hypothetical protein n=1 Tax=Escherichia coli TaxID=562 RepID=UPI0015E4F20B|nr:MULTISPECIES: hypothetical protein [Enterobacteriaceae]QLO06890.1 hypothetical protein HV141_25820 [Citrobacter freundii]VVY58726.1 Uncharacterised protein [Escherichia coli]VVZ63105.1 Uncharacterised protein [Escherichia coli]VWN02967.1 Uncharacterised protein [Escherichia coli]
MMTFLVNLYRTTATYRSCAFFTLVSGPAIAMFIAFVCLSFSGSPSAQLLDTARNVIDGAPVGKLLICADEPQSTTHPTPYPTPLNEPCVREAVDESIVTATWDSSFRMVYAILAMLSSVIWWRLNRKYEKF